jgi:hypothetical protein
MSLALYCKIFRQTVQRRRSLGKSNARTALFTFFREYLNLKLHISLSPRSFIGPLKTKHQIIMEFCKFGSLSDLLAIADARPNEDQICFVTKVCARETKNSVVVDRCSSIVV